MHRVKISKHEKLTLKTAYAAPDIVANTTPPNVGLPVMPSMYANNAIPVSHFLCHLHAKEGGKINKIHFTPPLSKSEVFFSENFLTKITATI